MEATVNIGTIILEDDLEVHEIIKAMLQENGITNYQIHSTPEEYLQHIDADINICVIDHKLDSGMTGFDVLKKVKQINKWSFVIIMTGQSDIEVVVQYLNAGADKYVSKSGRTIIEYMDDLIEKLIIGFDVAKERIRLVKLLEATKEIL